MDLPQWFYLSLGGTVLSIFLIYLSGIFTRKAIGTFLMFGFTILGSFVLWHGLNSAELQSRYNLGRPDPNFTKGSYHIVWGTYDTVNKKVYLFSSGKDEDPEQGPHLFVVDPSDKFLQKLLRELQKRRPFMMVVPGAMRGRDARRGSGNMQDSIEFHPEPPPTSAPKASQSG